MTYLLRKQNFRHTLLYYRDVDGDVGDDTSIAIHGTLIPCWADRHGLLPNVHMFSSHTVLNDFMVGYVIYK